MAAAKPVRSPPRGRRALAHMLRPGSRRSVKGKSQPVRAVSVGASIGMRTQRRANELHFVGRDPELAIVAAAMDAAIKGSVLDRGYAGAASLVWSTAVASNRTVIISPAVRLDRLRSARPHPRPARDRAWRASRDGGATARCRRRPPTHLLPMPPCSATSSVSTSVDATGRRLRRSFPSGPYR